MSLTLKGVPVSFKSFAKKTVPLGHRPQARPSEPGKFNMLHDLVPGQKIAYKYVNRLVTGVFTHYERGSQYGNCMIWADWSDSGGSSQGWMPPEQVILVE